MDEALLQEFRFDWTLAGKSPKTADTYILLLRGLMAAGAAGSLREAKQWVSEAIAPPSRRKRAQSIRAFGKWAEDHSLGYFEWWRHVPLAAEVETPQETATVDDFKRALQVAIEPRHKALMCLLWTTGMRRSEIANLVIADVDLVGGHLVVRQSKTKTPRIVPLAPIARKALRPFLGQAETTSLIGMSSNAIRQFLARKGLPSAHAWRRGWAVESLKSGVSETSVRAVAGWSSGAMVSRYIHALRDEVAIEEFSRSWTTTRNSRQ